MLPEATACVFSPRCPDLGSPACAVGLADLQDPLSQEKVPFIKSQVMDELESWGEHEKQLQ